MSASIKKYLIWGYYGFGNLGDELMLMQIVERIRARESHAIIRVACFDAPRDSRVVPFAFYKVRGPLPVRVLIQLISLATIMPKTDVFVIGGGTLFIDKGKHNRAMLTLTMAVFFAKIMHKIIYTIGVGTDILTHPRSMQYLRFILKNSSYVCLRDNFSFTTAKHLIGEAHVIRGSDILFDESIFRRLTGGVRHNGQDGCIVVSLTDYFWTWQLPGKRDLLRTKSEELVVRLTKQFGGKYTIVLCAFQKSMGENDYGFLTDILKSIAKQGEPNAVNVRLAYLENEEQVRNIFSAAVFTIGMRYHALVLSAIFKKPFLGINMEMKIKEICSEFGMPFMNIDEFLAHGFAADEFQRLSSLTISETILEGHIHMAERNFTWVNTR